MPRFKKFPDKFLPPDAPLYHRDHSKPISRRELIRQGFAAGGASILSGGLLNAIVGGMARADVSTDLENLATHIGCTLGSTINNSNTPFICFDLAGGANIAGSNVLIGNREGQMDTLGTAGYSRQGLPGDMIPGLSDNGFNLLNPSNGDFTNSELNLMFHADSPMLLGIRERATTAIGNVDGTVIPARSDNDTANNPHNPLYGIARTGSRGSVVDLIGSRASDSGGNSMAPAALIDAQYRPTKVDRPDDVLGMVDIGDMTSILNSSQDVSAVMESMARISHKKLETAGIDTRLAAATNTEIMNLVRCGYIKAADIAEYFTREFPTGVDPRNDSNILSIFSDLELANDREFAKTASVMFMVMQGFAAGGCITMGGYDYHTGDRFTGENRDLRAGRCIGACLEYAALMNKNLMIYVYSDGSVASNGMPDDSTNNGTSLGGRGKPQWTGDNSSTAASFFLVHSAGGPPPIINDSKRQIGFMDNNGAVVTGSSPAANNVNQLVNTVLLNYMALNGQISVGNTTDFTARFPENGLGSQASLDQLIAFNALPPPTP